MGTTGIEGDPPKDRVTYKIGEGITGRVADGETIITEDTRKIPGNVIKFHEKIKYMNNFTYVGLPIRELEGINKNVIAVIRCAGFSNKFNPESKSYPDVAELSLINLAADIVRPFLEIYHQAKLRDFNIARVTHDMKKDLKEIDETTRFVLDEDKRMSDFYQKQLGNIIQKIPSISHHLTRLDFTRIEKVSYQFRLTLLEGEIIARLKNLHKAESEYKKLNIYFDGFQAIPALYVDPPDLKLLLIIFL